MSAQNEGGAAPTGAELTDEIGIVLELAIREAVAKVEETHHVMLRPAGVGGFLISQGIVILLGAGITRESIENFMVTFPWENVIREIEGARTSPPAPPASSSTPSP